MKKIYKCKFITGYSEEEFDSKIIRITISFDTKYRSAWFDHLFLRVERTLYEFEDSELQKKIKEKNYYITWERDGDQLIILYIPKTYLMSEKLTLYLKTKDLEKYNY